MVLHCACHNYNLFINDADVVFLQNPYDNLLFESDIVIQASPIDFDWEEWGHFFFPENPNRIYTLNNGVIMYQVRSNPLALKRFIVDLVVECFIYLKKTTPLLINQPKESKMALGFFGFLQVVFNKMAVRAYVSLTKGGDSHCYDCYVGMYHTHNIKLSTFPLHRYVSNCDISTMSGVYNETEKERMHDVLMLSNDAIIRSNYKFSLAEWASNKNLLQSFHANCASEGNYETKMSIFRSYGLWILDYKPDQDKNSIQVTVQST